jgi:hypothetical protein
MNGAARATEDELGSREMHTNSSDRSEGMGPAITRRTLLTGAAFAAGGLANGGFFGASDALAASGAQSSDVTPGVAGTVISRLSPQLIEVRPLGTESRQRISLASGASVVGHTDLAVGDSLVAMGPQNSDGTMVSVRVMHAVFGVRADVER